MKKFFFISLLMLICATKQIFSQIILGIPNVNETANDLLLHSNGTFVVCGSEGSSGSIYQVTCSGEVLGKRLKAFTPGPTAFYQAIELPNGDLVAVGETRITLAGDTVQPRVVVLKMNANLTEIASKTLTVNGKWGRARSVALALNGDLLVLGETEGVWVDFANVFLMRINPNTLEPVDAPVTYSFGVDNAHRIERIGNDEYLISIFALIGNLFSAEAPIQNRLVTLKVNAKGQVQWQHIYEYARQAKYGFCRIGGAGRGIPPASSNILVCGVAHTEMSPDSLTDPVFLLLSPDGIPLDTLVVPLPGHQELVSVINIEALPGLAFAVGRTTLQPSAPSTLLGVGVLEANNQLLPAFVVNQTSTPIPLHDVQEVPYGRFAFVGTMPEGFIAPTRDIIVLPPAVEDVQLTQQNCTLSPSFNVPGPSFQWFRDSLPIVGATDGTYRPTQAGRYYVRITDALGCSGFSDTLTITWPKSAFTWSLAGGFVSFTNLSTHADTYEWDFGDGSSSTEKDPTHTYTASGQYIVTLITRSGCGADTARQIIGVVNTSESTTGRGFLSNIAPNPNTGDFTLSLSSALPGEVVYSLFRSDGQLIDRQIWLLTDGHLQRTLSYAPLAPGLYTVLLHAPGVAQVHKVVVH